MRSEVALLQRLLAQFPTQINRENILKNREFPVENREFPLPKDLMCERRDRWCGHLSHP